MGYDDYGELKLELLRAWQLYRHGVVVHVATRQQRLIAALAVKGPCLRSYLVGLLWPEYPDPRALESLRVSVHLISRQVPGLLVNHGALLALNDRVEVDLYRVRTQTQRLSTVASEEDWAPVLYELRDADLLPGWYEDWVVFEQSRLQQDRLRAFTILAGQSLDQGYCDRAEAAAEAALELEPLYEAAVRILVAAELQHGNPAAALRDYERYRERLEEDMGLKPSEALRRLITDAIEGRVRASEEHLVVPAGDPLLSGYPLLHHL